jgi:ketosteroid isomerase-like protein
MPDAGAVASSNLAARVVDWMRRWESLINTGDIETARPMFDPSVIAFGSLTAIMDGRDALIGRQWSQMWPRLKDFAFAYDDARILGGEGDRTVSVAAPWRSLGRKGDGWYERRGRCTLVLRHAGDDFVCIHSHFSMEPGIPPVAD